MVLIYFFIFQASLHAQWQSLNALTKEKTETPINVKNQLNFSYLSTLLN